MYPRHHHWFTDRIVLVLMPGSLLPVGTLAADAHLAVKPQPGNILLLRNVSTRPAYRPAPPGMALMADPSPRHGLARALGTDELRVMRKAAQAANEGGNPANL